jgi:hypothetical protein
MRKVGVAAVAFAWGISVPPVIAQQPPRSTLPSPQSLERIRAALDTPRATLVSPPWLPPDTTGPVIKTWGWVSFVTPDGTTNGEIVKIRIPAGELTMRAARAIAAAQHRRAERRARAEVIRDLQEFQAQQVR